VCSSDLNGSDQDFSRPHTANKTNETLRNFKWQVLEHPPYNPDLASSDLYFPDDEAVEREVSAWFQQQPKELHAAGFQGLVK
jgi:hypothetical protein